MKVCFKSDTLIFIFAIWQQWLQQSNSNYLCLSKMEIAKFSFCYKQDTGGLFPTERALKI